jgi:cytochrome c peroxidase
MGWVGWRVLVVIGFAAVGTAFAVPTPTWHWKLPAGTPPPPVSAGNPISAAKVALGRRLFYDADLSMDGTISCATCHEQHHAFADGNRTHGGVRGASGRRNVMGLANVAYFTPLTWADPRQRHLDEQALVPLTGSHPVEMGMAGQDAELARRLAADSCYRQMFAAAFPDGHIDTERVTMAIASFEQTLLSFDSPYDLFRRGDSGAISAQAKAGNKLFETRCTGCHAGPNFTDAKFHNIGLPNRNGAPATDRGLREVTGAPRDEGAFRTPSLRNAALTAPYMHDGSIPDLASAIRDHTLPSAAGRALNAADLSRIVAFLQSLSDLTFVTNSDFALPKSACGKPL